MFVEGQPSHRILAIEDDIPNATLLRDILEEEGLGTVSLVRSAEDARIALSEESEPPTLIILDLDLPGEHGLAYLETLKSDDSLYRDIPVLVVSSESDEYEKTCRRFGAADYLKKPYTLDQLIKKVKALI
jgi:DNA-binding response OmpR family regulator